MADFVVAIDGNAGSGKSTTAKGVAKRLGFFYLDTGAMYRAVTLKYLRRNRNIDQIDMSLITEVIRDTDIDLRLEDSEMRVFLDGEDVSSAIRTPEVNNAVSPISAIPEIRNWMVDKQRKVAEGKRVVCEGRDIGTVVFPEAEIKIYMQADLKVRARRRAKELAEKNLVVNLPDIIENLKYRDQYDSNREHSPLKKAEDAIIVDTTNLTIEEEILLVEKLVKEKLQKTPKM